jgi:hypothetical protein
VTPPPSAKEVSAGYGELMLAKMPAIDQLTSLGWKFKNLYAESFGELGSDDHGGKSLPQLFHPNAFILLSNGSDTRGGPGARRWLLPAGLDRLAAEGGA